MSSSTNGEQPIKALAAHKKGLTLEPFEYKPEPLGNDDIGELHCFSTVVHDKGETWSIW